MTSSSSSPSSPSTPATPAPDSPKTPVVSHPSNGFAEDDAFSDGDDSPSFNASSILDDIAEDLRKSHLAQQEREQDIGEEEDARSPDASVSTFDIDGSPMRTPVSLRSASVHSSHAATSTNGSIDIDSSDAQSHYELRSKRSFSPSHGSFTSVVIDLAKPPESQVIVVSTESHSDAPSSPSSSRKSVSIAENMNDSTSPRSATLSVSYSMPPLPGATGGGSSKLAVHRQTKSTAGPSALEKVISKTRPTFLPPKRKDEDNKHLADWEDMMQRSRAADELKRKARYERRLAREKAVEDNTVKWETCILPDVKNAMQDWALKRMWWQGVPPKLRGVVWEKVVGNSLALSKNSYKSCLARARRALDGGTFPTTTLNLIDTDIQSTLPSLHIFTPKIGPMYEDLLNVLCAWVVSRSDEGLGYAIGASKIAAMFLLNMQPPDAFLCMRNLIERHCMRSFYGGISSTDDVEAYYRIFDTLLADYMPKMYFNFKQHKISPGLYLPQWLVPIFLDHLPLEACCRIWDVLILEGDSFLFRVALAILAVLEPRLLFPEKSELLSVVNGTNKAAIEVARRNDLLFGVCKFEIYDITEDTIWEQLEAMQSWWKENTWNRLIQRELPDL